MKDPGLAAPTIIIAEDQEALREVLVEMLAGEGFDVVGSTAEGSSAVELAQRLKPDLALLDYRLPGTDGVTATQAIKEQSPDTQVVMITAYNEASLSLEATLAGVSAFLVKGCDPSLILGALRAALPAK
jgi:DNA-binding NarL/FixJ family response regulator